VLFSALSELCLVQERVLKRALGESESSGAVADSIGRGGEVSNERKWLPGGSQQ